MNKNNCYKKISNDLSSILGINLKRENANIFGNNVYYIQFMENSLIRLELIERGKFRKVSVSTYNEDGFQPKSILCIDYHENKQTELVYTPFPSEEEFFIEYIDNNLVFTYEQYCKIIEYFKNHEYAISIEIMLREKGCTCK